MVGKWDMRFVELARLIAAWSDDRERKIGCVIVGADHGIRAIGYNGFPRAVDSEIHDRHTRDNEEKYKWIEHAERNAIYAAARAGVSIDKATMYLTWFPCGDCARAIIQSGIVRVVAAKEEFNDPRWGEHLSFAEQILREAGVKIDFFN